MRPALRRGKSVWGWGGREGDETSSLQSRTHLRRHRNGSWSSSATRELCSEGTRPGSTPRSAAALRPAQATMDLGEISNHICQALHLEPCKSVACACCRWVFEAPGEAQFQGERDVFQCDKRQSLQGVSDLFIPQARGDIFLPSI